MESYFFFVSSEVVFQEAKGKGARILATFCELDKPSSNNRIYRFEEGESMAKSLINKPIRYGANWLGKHLKSVPVIGRVQKAWVEGKKIKGIVRIWAKDIVNKLKNGIKFLFSVGGKANFAESWRQGKKTIYRLYSAICTHLQLLPDNPEGAGFPSARIHKILEINESVMLANYNVRVCNGDTCKILEKIESEFEESLRIDKFIEESIVMESVLYGISI